MATAKKLPSGSWRCQVFSHYEEIPQPDGTVKKKRVYKSFTCDDPSKKGKRICEKEAAMWAIDREKKSDNVNMTLNEAVTSYIGIKTNVLSESTITGYKVIQRNYMASIGHLKLHQFTKPIVQKWVNDISSGKSPKTVKNAYGLFSATMEMFADKSFKIKFPQQQPKEIYIPSDEDVKNLLRHATGDFKIALYLAAFGGLRRGEICALTRSDVYDGYITISNSMGMSQDRTWIIKAPKTEGSERNVLLPDFLIDMLKEKEDRIVNMTPDHVTEKFCVLRDKLNLKHFRFHDLRHYYVSVNHAIGIPDQYIMEMGGWKTDRTMKAVYRNTLAPERNMFAQKSMAHFESMQHEMQHELKKVQ